MGKVEIDNFSFLTRDIFNKISEVFIEKYSRIHMTFVQIASFDWLSWQKKYYIFY